MIVLPLLEKHLCPDVVHEIYDKWLDRDLYQYLTQSQFINHNKRILLWFRLFKKFIQRNDSSPPQQAFLSTLVESSKKCNVKEHPFLLTHLLLLAVQYNHLPCIHSLLDLYHTVVAEKKFAQPLFAKALKSNRPHLLRLFLVLWNFQISVSFLKKCVRWIHKNSNRQHNFASCEHECQLFIPTDIDSYVGRKIAL